MFFQCAVVYPPSPCVLQAADNPGATMEQTVTMQVVEVYCEILNDLLTGEHVAGGIKVGTSWRNSCLLFMSSAVYNLAPTRHCCGSPAGEV